jgi:glutamine amidotransferase
MSVSIIDYGMGNLRSVQKGFEKAGCEARVISKPHEVDDAKALVLPGVGAFKNCLLNLESFKLINPIVKAIKSGKPFLGICLGLQILFTESEEFGRTQGLDIIKGKVSVFQAEKLMSSSDRQLKIPHMGWNKINIIKNNPYLKDIEDCSFLYFVHSYYVIPEDSGVVTTKTNYGIDFVSSIWKDNIFACQFHPEKSQSIGLKILKNFADIAA